MIGSKVELLNYKTKTNNINNNHNTNHLNQTLTIINLYKALMIANNLKIKENSAHKLLSMTLNN